jgi:hypothetical protein
MAIKWTAWVVLLFMPEDSSGFGNEPYFYRPGIRTVMEKPGISVKALVWIFISILLGLGISQLR